MANFVVCVAPCVWPVWPCGPVCVAGVAVCVWLCVWPCACVRERRKGGPVAGPPLLWCAGGGVLLSHTLAGAVPSALAVLASGFGKGKGPGVSLPLWPPPRLPGPIMRPP